MRVILQMGSMLPAFVCSNAAGVERCPDWLAPSRSAARRKRRFRNAFLSGALCVRSGALACRSIPALFNS